MQQQMRAAVALSVVMSLAGCADSQNPEPGEETAQGAESGQQAEESVTDEAAPEADQLERLVEDFGGRDGLADFLLSTDHDEIGKVLALYGMAYEAHSVDGPMPKAISACTKYFPSSDRAKWHSFDGEFYYIDSNGRPKEAYKNLPPVVAAPRTNCQGTIGQWGDAENPSNDYDGGHLIGAQLGGWGGRANIVPQDSNFNQVNYAQMENRAALCRALPSGRIRWEITLTYPNSSALIPNTWRLFTRNNSSGAYIGRTFSNVDGGGSSGTTYRNEIVNFLSGQGCN